MAYSRYKGHPTDPIKHAKSLEKREAYLNTAQVAQKFMIAVPKEFTVEQARETYVTLFKNVFVSRGLSFDMVLHKDKGNPHIHAMVTRRALEGESFSCRKDIDVTDKKFLLFMRKATADATNEMLESIGSSERVTEKSFKDLGIGIEGSLNTTRYPTVSFRVAEENEAIQSENYKSLLEKPEDLIRLVAASKSVLQKRI